MASFEQNQSSRLWSVRFRIIEDGKETHKRLSGYKTKKEANAAYVDFMSEYKEKQALETANTPNSELTYAQLYNEFKTYYQTRVKETTFYDFCSKSDLHIVPYFKDMAVAKIKPLDVLNWQTTIDNYSHQYKCNLRGLLSNVLKYAERYHDIPNVLPRVENFRNRSVKQEMQCWTTEEFKTFISVVDKEEYFAFFNFLFFTGCRRGEALALYWDDIDFDKKTVSFNKSVTNKVVGKTWFITTPKNASSVRTIRLSDNLLQILREHKQQQREQCGDCLFVFGNNAPLSETSLSRYFKMYCQKANVKKIRLHDFRHSHASYLISQGVSIVAIAKRLGHANIEQTLNTYAHLMPNEEDRLIEKLNEI